MIENNQSGAIVWNLPCFGRKSNDCSKLNQGWVMFQWNLVCGQVRRLRRQVQVKKPFKIFDFEIRSGLHSLFAIQRGGTSMFNTSGEAMRHSGY